MEPRYCRILYSGVALASPRVPYSQKKWHTHVHVSHTIVVKRFLFFNAKTGSFFFQETGNNWHWYVLTQKLLNNIMNHFNTWTYSFIKGFFSKMVQATFSEKGTKMIFQLHNSNFEILCFFDKIHRNKIFHSFFSSEKCVTSL